MRATKWNPSAEEIRQACKQIRESWSELEHRRRAGWGKETDRARLWTAPELNARDFGLLEGRTVREF